MPMREASDSQTQRLVVLCQSGTAQTRNEEASVHRAHLHFAGSLCVKYARKFFDF